MSTLGENIKSARIRKGMTQEELAVELKTTKAAISRYELDKRQPSNDRLKAIANALNVSVGFLLGYDNIDAQNILAAFERKDFCAVEQLAELPGGFISSLSEKGIAELERLMRLKICGSEILFEDLLGFLRTRYTELTPDEEVTLEELVDAFSLLNDEGRIVAVCRVKELAEIPKYQKEKPPQD